MTLLVTFPGSAETSGQQVGGKASSLIRMAAAGYRVPPGAVVTTEFFAPWFTHVQASRAWGAFRQTEPARWSECCAELQSQVATLEWNSAQREALDKLRDFLSRTSSGEFFAVRSSSPEEDTASASFAGLYETRLGVRLEQIEDALRGCFASALDLRVIRYKHERGLDAFDPRFAAVVQLQIESEVAGVAFSLNPITNDYDEAVVASSWGLGPSIVDGRVSADHFVVDKVSGRIIAETRGQKELSVRLDPAGGTIERREDRSTERTLDDRALAELTRVIAQIEALYGCPIDIEWAYAGGALHLLQARPITAYIPLPQELQTQPGERRRLYIDGALSRGLTMNAPVSVLGLDAIKSGFTAILESWTGPMQPAPRRGEALFLFAGARMYGDLSGLLWLATPSMLAKGSAATDTLMAGILASIDREQYRSPVRPQWLGVKLLWLVPRIVWGLRGLLWGLLKSATAPEAAYRAYRRTVENLEAALSDAINDHLSLEETQERGQKQFIATFDTLMAALLVGQCSPRMVIRRKSVEEMALADKLERGVPGNVVVEMGLALHRLARLVDRGDFKDPSRLAERVERREMPVDFLSAWDDFVARFGCRGPLEMDLASPRYGDDPRLMLQQMAQLAVAGGLDPEALHRQQARERQEAYDALMRRFGPLRRALLRRLYRLNHLFAGSRDTPKHLAVLGNYVVRRHALAVGQRLVEAGRLEAACDVFDLTFEDLRRALDDPTLDLRSVREGRVCFTRTLRAHVHAFPPVIDSRGRVLRPKASVEEPGLLRGMPVSRGVATGPVKVLRRADEKRIESGDVLVAYTTDPGWTPLFLNAAAVVLEVGGVLQHGAVVAREFGKPCVVGIDRVVERLRDGDLVEVDGTAGIVRLNQR
jgi:pyruvate,water dikinase